MARSSCVTRTWDSSGEILGTRPIPGRLSESPGRVTLGANPELPRVRIELCTLGGLVELRRRLTSNGARMSKALLFSAFMALSWGLAACGAGEPAPTQGALEAPGDSVTRGPTTDGTADASTTPTVAGTPVPSALPTPSLLPAETSAPLSTEPTPASDVKVGPQVGQRAPDFNLTTIDGQTITLSSFLGKRPFILYFFATW